MRIGAWILFLVGVLALLLDGQEAEHMPVDREIGDEEVLRLVNRRYPGLGDFAAAMGAGDLTKARLLLVKHLSQWKLGVKVHMKLMQERRRAAVCMLMQTLILLLTTIKFTAN